MLVGRVISCIQRQVSVHLALNVVGNSEHLNLTLKAIKTN